MSVRRGLLRLLLKAVTSLLAISSMPTLQPPCPDFYVSSFLQTTANASKSDIVRAVDAQQVKRLQSSKTQNPSTASAKLPSFHHELQPQSCRQLLLNNTHSQRQKKKMIWRIELVILSPLNYAV